MAFEVPTLPYAIAARKQAIELGNIGCVMFAVMKLKCFSGNVWR